MLDDAGVPLRAVRTVAARLQADGHDSAAVLRDVGIDASRLFDPQARIPMATWMALWARAELVSRDPAFGLRAGELIDLRVFESIGYETEYVLMQLVVCSATVGDALTRMARYYAIGFGPSRLEIVRTGSEVEIGHRPPAGTTAPRSLAECAITVLTTMMRDLGQPSIRARAVSFVHAAPPSLAEHERVLGVTPTFGADVDAITVAAGALSRPLRSAQPRLVIPLEARADELLAALRPPTPFEDRVQQVMQLQLEHHSDQTAEGVARALQISVRTLSRRLSAAGTSHHTLLDQLRSKLASRHLIDSEMTVRDIAHRLGFADSSAFHRAFKRWYGRSPTEYRRDGAAKA